MGLGGLRAARRLEARELGVERADGALELVDAGAELRLGLGVLELRPRVRRGRLELRGGLLDVVLVAVAAAARGDQREGAHCDDSRHQLATGVHSFPPYERERDGQDAATDGQVRARAGSADPADEVDNGTPHHAEALARQPPQPVAQVVARVAPVD